MTRVGLVVLSVLVGCTSDGGRRGGGDDDTDNGCSLTMDACIGDTICATPNGAISGGSCVNAFPRLYTFYNFLVVAPTTKPDGQPWDVGGGAPDPFVTLAINGTVIGTTPAAADSFSARVPGSIEALVSAGSSLLVKAWDEDATVDDAVFECAAAPLTADLLRARHLQCAVSGYSLTMDVELVHD